VTRRGIFGDKRGEKVMYYFEIIAFGENGRF
jgi:hypothetical protein